MTRKRKHKKRPGAREKRAAAKRRAERKWKRPWQPSPGTPPEVAGFMQELGLVRPLPEPAFEKAIAERFGQRGREFLDARPSKPLTDYAAVHAAVASSLELSIAAASQFFAGFYESFLSRFAGAGLPAPRRVVDVGSGSGITTCFYARLYPGAEILGVDVCPEMVRCAQDLAAKLSVDNVSFEVTDALDLPEHLARQKADIVTSTFVAHEVGEPHGKPARTIEEAWAGPLDRRLAGYAEALAGLLEPTGVLVTAERLGNVMAFARWARALQDAGIGVDCEQVELIEFVERHDQRSKVPVLLGSKNRGVEICAERNPRDVAAEGEPRRIAPYPRRPGGSGLCSAGPEGPFAGASFQTGLRPFSDPPRGLGGGPCGDEVPIQQPRARPVVLPPPPRPGNAPRYGSS